MLSRYFEVPPVIFLNHLRCFFIVAVLWVRKSHDLMDVQRYYKLIVVLTGFHFLNSFTLNANIAHKAIRRMDIRMEYHWLQKDRY